MLKLQKKIIPRGQQVKKENWNELHPNVPIVNTEYYSGSTSLPALWG
jgi:hypothetical protein